MIKKKCLKLACRLRDCIASQPASKLVFIIGLVICTTYFNGLFNGFVWDDEEQILNNPVAHSLANWWRSFFGSTFNTGGGGVSGFYYRPVMMIFFIVNWLVWGKLAFGFHLAQIGLHIANAGLVFWLVKSILEEAKVKQAKTIGFWTALIWGVHAGISEAVFYISSVQEELFVLFSLTALLILVKGKKNINWWWYGFLSWFGLVSKEAAVTGMAIGGLYLLWLKRNRDDFWRWLMTSSLVIGAYAVARFGIAKVGLSSFSVVPIVKASLAQRLMTVPYTIVSYLRISFWPERLFITHHFVVPSFADVRFWGSLLVLATLLTVLALTGRNRSRTYWFWWLWFLVGISLVLNIFPLDMSLAERWLYFPLIGVAAAVVWQVVDRAKTVSVLILSAVVVLLGTRTWLRSYNWRSGLILYGHDIKLNSGAYDLNNNYGTELYRAGRRREAKKYFLKSVELAPDWWVNRSNLGVALASEGQEKQAERQYRQALTNGSYYLAYENLAGLLFNQKRYKEVIEIGEAGLKSLPANFKLSYLTALAYYRLGRLDEAAQLVAHLNRWYLDDPQVMELTNLIQSAKKDKP